MMTIPPYHCPSRLVREKKRAGLSITNLVGRLDGASTGAREPESTGFDDLGSAEAIASYGRWSASSRGSSG
jgi:hypothetical protein